MDNPGGARVFVVRGNDVAHETIDGETVIIDMAEGTYYRLEGGAALVWSQIIDGATEGEVLAMLADQFDAGPGGLETELRRFLSELVDYKLIVGKERHGTAPGVAMNGSARASFSGLAIHRFTDLKELFWLDPVHEVDDTGWPSPQPATDG